MNVLVIISQIIVGLGIYNVWLLRARRTTDWRGGAATNLKEEFAVYGLPPWFMAVIGVLKIAFATLLLAGIWYGAVTKPAAAGMAALMLGAVAMHFKVGDPIKKAVPAASLLALSLFILLAQPALQG